MFIFIHLFSSLKYFSFRRLVNYFKLQLSYILSILGIRTYLHTSPYFISVESANFCNLHCPECPVGNKSNHSPAHIIFDNKRYQKLVDELAPKLIHIIFYFQGEPLLNLQLFEMVSYAHRAKLYTSTSTNAQFLTHSRAKELVLSGLDKLIISVDGSTQETYETYRIGGKLEKALNGIRHVVALKKELKSVTPLIEVQFLVLKTNEHQMKEMQQLTKSLGADRLTFKTAQLYDFANGHKLMPSTKKYSRYQQNKNGNYQLKAKQPNHCWRLWNGAVVNSNGNVLPCCFDKLSEFSFGNISEDTFMNNWQKKKASDFRGKILQNRKQFEICRNCTSR